MPEHQSQTDERVTCRTCRGEPQAPGRICPPCNGRGWEPKKHPEWVPDPAAYKLHGPHHPNMTETDFDACPTCLRRRWNGHSLLCTWRDEG